MVFITDDGREYPVRMASESEIADEWPPIKQELIAAMADDDPERYMDAAQATVHLLVPDLPLTDIEDLSPDDIKQFVTDWQAQQLPSIEWL